MNMHIWKCAEETFKENLAENVYSKLCAIMKTTKQGMNESRFKIDLFHKHRENDRRKSCTRLWRWIRFLKWRWIWDKRNQAQCSTKKQSMKPHRNIVSLHDDLSIESNYQTFLNWFDHKRIESALNWSCSLLWAVLIQNRKLTRYANSNQFCM